MNIWLKFVGLFPQGDEDFDVTAGIKCSFIYGFNYICWSTVTKVPIKGLYLVYILEKEGRVSKTLGRFGLFSVDDLPCSFKHR